MDSVATKQCTRCAVVKPITEYAPRKGRPLGVQSQCRQCQNDVRRARSPEEREVVNAKVRARRAADPAVREREQERRRRNLSYYRDWQRKWRQANPDKTAALAQKKREATAANPKPRRVARDINERTRDWYHRNKDRTRLSRLQNQQLRRARLADSGAFLVTQKDLRRIMAAGCAVDGCHAIVLHLDHMIPIARGGRHSVGNLQALCGKHNRMKFIRTWMEFRVYLMRRATP